MNRRILVAVAALPILGTRFAAAVQALEAPAADRPPRPNIVLILADDLGYSDLGCYGGEIGTPNVDRLAANGLRFARFYNSAKCEPTRSSLMSGRYWQDCGMGVKRGPTLGEAMRAAGYATFAVGKWHLDGNPVERGFDHYFGHLSGASDYFQGHPSHRLDLEPFQPSGDRFYTTDANAEYAVRFIEEAHRKDPARPFFLYLAFNAPHAPLQAWPEDIARYRGRYRAGWDRLREERYARQIDIGLVRREWALPPRPDTLPAWVSLSPEEQDFEDLRMAIFAAMVDRMDRAVGTVVAKIEALGRLRDTLVLFLSDNGADPFDRGRRGRLPDPTAHWEYGLGWSHLCNTPFRYYKRNMFHGGSCTPLVAHWPAGLTAAPGSITDAPGHIVDLMPTVLDLAGAGPGTPGVPAPDSGPGRSLRPIFEGRDPGPRGPLFFQLFDHRAIIAGDHKLVSDWGQPWQLFDLAADRTETRDLAPAQSDRVRELERQWSDWFGRTAEQRLRAAGPEPVYRRMAEAERSPSGRTVRPRSAAKTDAAGPRRTSGVRGRVGTTVSIDDGALVLDCTGVDPGVAFDSLHGTAAGPFTFTFRMNSTASGEGEVFWTTDPATTLPRGSRLPFQPVHNGQWHDVSLKIPEPKPLRALRLDPCAGPGRVRIEALELRDGSGRPVPLME